MTEKKTPKAATFYEGFLARHLPGVYARREEARLRGQAFASYRGGVSTRTSSGWSGSTSHRTGTVGDRLLLGEMRSRGRKAYKDNPVARSLVNTEADNIVADGMRLQARTEDEAFNQEAEERYAEYIDRADVRGLRHGGGFERAVWITHRVDGDCAVILVDRGGESRMQLIPGDLISTPDGLNGRKDIVDGVEIDAAAQPIAFHILDTDEWGKREWTRYDARQVIYLPNLNDADALQLRGETCFAQIFDTLDNLDQYIDGVALAAWMATVFGVIFKEPNAAKQHGLLQTIQNSAGVSQRALRLENGSVKYLAPEGEVVQVDAKQPMQQTPEFVRMMLRMLGLPFDMPLEMIGKDMSQVNFASARIGLLGYYRACRTKQQRFIKRFDDRHYQWWISRERKKQELGIAGAFVTRFPELYWPHEFIPRGWDYTDPVSEAQGDLLEISMGTKTRQMVASERGRDLIEMAKDHKEANALLEAAGVPKVLSNHCKELATTDGGAPDPELERIKAEADAYGVAVRAGVVTPQTDDEAAFRTKLSLPPMSSDAQKAWTKDEGVRRPITLTPPPGSEPVTPFGGKPAPTETPDE